MEPEEPESQRRSTRSARTKVAAVILAIQAALLLAAIGSVKFALGGSIPPSAVAAVGAVSSADVVAAVGLWLAGPWARYLAYAMSVISIFGWVSLSIVGGRWGLAALAVLPIGVIVLLFVSKIRGGEAA